MARHPSTTGTACVIAASCCSQWSLFVAVIVMAASCLFGAAGVSGGPLSVKGTRGSEAIQVDTHASVQYSSVDALFPDLRGLTQAPARAASSAATRPASTKAVKVDGGTIEYLHAEDILDHQSTTATPASGIDSSKVKDDGRGWPTWGPGRAQGSGLHLRRSLEDVLVVMFATMANESLSERFDSSERVFLSLAALRKLRMEYNHITYKALHGRVWDLAPSGAIGVVLCFSALGSRDHNGQHQLLVATASLEGGEVVVTCSEEERCLGDGGCSLRVPMRTAVERVRCAMGVTLADLFEVLEAAVNKRRLLAGRGVLYGRKTCVVRNGSTSWPFSAVRRSRGGTWVCLSCRTSDVTCDHAGSALAAAKAAEDGTETVSETEETDEDEADLVSLFNSDPAKHQEASGAVEGPPHLPSATLPLVPVNCVKWRARSNESRHLVPPLVAQRERAELMRALRDPSHRVSYPAGAQCPYCLVGRASKTPVRDKVATVEFEDGVVLAAVKVWRCHKCLYRVLPDGKARGVVFSSSCTAYSEAFLFEVAVNLARNGSSLHSTAYLREAFVELHTGSKYPPTTDRLRSVTTLRQALLLYLSLVLKDLPYDSVSCATCRRPDGSYAVVSFDGLQLGYRVKYKKPFDKTEINIRAVARASLVPRLITDEAVSKAFGGVLSAKRDVVASASSKPITTVAAIRGHVMAVEMLLGNVEVDGVDKSFAGSKPHMIGGRSNRGWDAVVDGGVAPELVAFLRGAFDVRMAAKSLALTILAASDDMRRRVPAELMGRINELVTHVPPAPPPPPVSLKAQRAAELAAGDADLLCADKKRGQKRVRMAAVRHSGGDSNSSTECSSSIDVFDSDDGADIGVARGYQRPPETKWEHDAPLLNYGEAFEEPALATTGGATGEERLQHLAFSLLAHIPHTAASTLKVMDFVRAVVVDPVFVWSPQGSWDAVDEVLAVLRSDNFSVTSLSKVLHLPVVTEQRLLRGAVACLGPGLESSPALRELLAGVLDGLKKRAAAYDAFVADGTQAAVLDGPAAGDLREEMAAAHPLTTFTHEQFSGGWLLPPASVALYRSVYGEYTDQWDDYMRTGVWAPGLPVLRPGPGFIGAATANTDLPSCNHEMGKENSHTGGTVGVFCTCSHPKCIGVMVLTGAESQRMPLEFVVQRFVVLPATIIYDFACATLKSALVRLPLLARRVACKCDRFHWRKNHTDCSCAMNPDSYESLDGVNTSSCEERNALSRRQQHHLRQMKQDQFITFTIYQQVLSNAVAMHRDAKSKGVTMALSRKWPEWYRRLHVDVTTAQSDK